MTKLRVLDLFSGIGGFSLGLERTGGFETVAFCEISPFCRKVLSKHWPDVPQFTDVRKIRGEDVGTVDIICGGYPCQPFSTAGQRRGKEDDRHLWPEFNRLVAELRPAWVIGENVAGHISMGLDDVLSDLEGQGYACRTFDIPAVAVGAPHRRARCWIVGHAERAEWRAQRQTCDGLAVPDNGIPQWPKGAGRVGGASEDVADAKKLQRNGSGADRQSGKRQVPEFGKRSGAQPMADAGGGRQPGPGKPINAIYSAARKEREAAKPFDGGFGAKWLPEPNVGRVANGVPKRMDRLKALGNAVVPQIPEMIGHAILQAEAAQ